MESKKTTKLLNHSLVLTKPILRLLCLVKIGSLHSVCTHQSLSYLSCDSRREEVWTTKLSPTNRLSNINIQTVTDKEMVIWILLQKLNYFLRRLGSSIERQSIRSGFWEILGITKTSFNDPIRSISGLQWWTHFPRPPLISLCPL